MKDTKYLEILKAPVITEKSQIAKSEGKYTFKVDPKANKTEIKAAIEKIFKVKVTSIKTLNEKHREFLEKCPLEIKINVHGKKLAFKHFLIQNENADYPFYLIDILNKNIVNEK